MARFFLIAYVCGGDCVKKAANDWEAFPFEMIYTMRPNNCRYAVCKERDLSDLLGLRGRFVVFDLYEVRAHKPTFKFKTPKPVLICDDPDQAIMATSLLYKGEG